MKNLETSLIKLFKNIVKLKSNETILIIGCDEGDGYIVADAFYRAAKQFTTHANLIIHPQRGLDKVQERPVLGALKSDPDVFIITNLYQDGNDFFALEHGYIHEGETYHWYPQYLQGSKKARGFWFTPGSVEQFLRAIDTDYKQLLIDSRKVVHELNKAEKVVIKDNLGTNLEIDISDKNRKAKADYDGNQHLPGFGVNLPMGEVLISPVMGKTKGVAFIDVEFFDEENARTVLADKPIKVTFENGIVKSVSGGRAATRFNQIILSAEKSVSDLYKKKKLTKKEYLEQLRNIKSVSEFAIGLHRNAGDSHNNFIGDLLYDEKIYGTCHIAFGSSYDGDNAPYHSDFIFSKPEVYLYYKNRTIKLICKNRKVFL